jgi:hypothetical protein
MRKLLEERKGQRLYVFTTFGAVYAGVFEQVLDDVVQLRAPDGSSLVFVNLSDVSGIREYDEDDGGAL